MTYKKFQTTNEKINKYIQIIEKNSGKKVKIEYETRFDGIHYAYRIFLDDNLASLLVNMDEEMLQESLRSYCEWMT